MDQNTNIEPTDAELDAQIEAEMGGQAAPAAPPAAPATPPVAAAPATPAKPQTPTTQARPSIDIAAAARLRRSERIKYGQAQRAKLDDQARELGYENHAAMIEAVRAQKGAQEPEVEEDGIPQDVRAALEAGENARAENERLKSENLRLKKRVLTLKDQLGAAQQEMELRAYAYDAGIRDAESTDIALLLLRKQISKLDDAALKDFNEQEFFTTLRTSKPNLFGEVAPKEVPANTGAPTKAPVSKPAPERVQAENGSAGADKRNGMKMSQQDYRARLAELGIPDPSAGL